MPGIFDSINGRVALTRSMRCTSSADMVRRFNPASSPISLSKDMKNHMPAYARGHGNSYIALFDAAKNATPDRNEIVEIPINITGCFCKNIEFTVKNVQYCINKDIIPDFCILDTPPNLKLKVEQDDRNNVTQVHVLSGRENICFTLKLNQCANGGLTATALSRHNGVRSGMRAGYAASTVVSDGGQSSFPIVQMHDTTNFEPIGDTLDLVEYVDYEAEEKKLQGIVVDATNMEELEIDVISATYVNGKLKSMDGRCSRGIVECDTHAKQWDVTAQPDGVIARQRRDQARIEHLHKTGFRKQSQNSDFLRG